MVLAVAGPPSLIQFVLQGILREVSRSVWSLPGSHFVVLLSWELRPFVLSPIGDSSGGFTGSGVQSGNAAAGQHSCPSLKSLCLCLDGDKVRAQLGRHRATIVPFLLLCWSTMTNSNWGKTCCFSHNPNCHGQGVSWSACLNAWPGWGSRIFSLSPAARNQEVQHAQSSPVPPLAGLHSLKLHSFHKKHSVQCSLWGTFPQPATGAFKQSYPLPPK